MTAREIPVGTPAAIPLAPSDERVLRELRTTNDLLRRLVRVMEEQRTAQAMTIGEAVNETRGYISSYLRGEASKARRQGHLSAHAALERAADQVDEDTVDLPPKPSSVRDPP
ncbi:MAG TPA: hypothetical protein VFH54_06035 [Mycobacteriales bacterium]|nr:hypothetical protein [Mycobacteriales bacterium]